MKKTIALIGTSALLLFLGCAAPSYAQEQYDIKQAGSGAAQDSE